MALSIKNEEVEQLVRRISAETGEGITETIRSALEQHFEKIQRAKRGPNLFDEIRAISKRCAALPTLDIRDADEILGYDNRGAW